MSGDSPNAFTNENVFDFKEGRSSPGPTTSKEPQTYVQASVLVEPKGKDKDKEKKDDEEDQPDFSSPILNNGEKDKRRGSDPDRTLESEPKGGGTEGKDNKDEKEMLNGGLDRLPRSYATDKNYDDDESEEDTCIVNCIYYTMECCKCSIV